MNSTRPLVLVVGAGPTGLVAALTLLQNGIPVRIIDKDPNPRIGQRGPGIWPRSFELFNFLNVPEVNELAKPVLTIQSLMTRHVEPTPTIPFHVPKLIGQQLLDVILRRHLEKFSCSVEMGTELRSFEQSDEGVTAVLAKNGILETFNTKWVIGADGARGIVRKQLGLTFLGETRDDIRLVMGDIRLHGVGLDREYWHRFGTFKRGYVQSLPLKVADVYMTLGSVSLRPTDEIGEDGWQFVIIDNNLDTTKVAQSEELIFETITSVRESRANIRMVNKFSEGRVFVAGDAAHVHSPTGGQGLNSSIQDAFNLGWKLALVEKGLADKSLLETYNAERLPVISEMLEMTTTILDQALKTDSITIARTPILFMLGINYRFSDIVLDEFAIPGKPINAYGVLDEEHLEAGDRAPDAPNLVQVGGGESDVKTLFSLYRPWYHTVLVFAPSHADAAPILGMLEAYDTSVVRSAVVLPSSASVTSVASPADLILVDQESHAYSAYLMKAGQARVFVIRPDGVIGAIVQGTEGVKKYFSGIFLDV
ncbi:FAD binding domain-containing protein [Suillus discolor]|uniref:FAD binding domain-containing protein n=1 Tax=Suillus discolor TaxID=1912936 RepID=A0A9P7FF45_9AGAM|nr:FAD binding domain-containing protein [Suillus discolor]KAG2113860.1 FAD binding domain-containing protein [Suillus discolor]